MIYEDFESHDAEAFRQVSEAERFHTETLFLKKIDEPTITVGNVQVAKIFVVEGDTRRDTAAMSCIKNGYDYHGMLSLSRTYHDVGTHAVANMMLIDGWKFCDEHEYVTMLETAQKDLEQWK